MSVENPVLEGSWQAVTHGLVAREAARRRDVEDGAASPVAPVGVDGGSLPFGGPERLDVGANHERVAMPEVVDDRAKAVPLAVAEEARLDERNRLAEGGARVDVVPRPVACALERADLARVKAEEKKVLRPDLRRF